MKMIQSVQILSLGLLIAQCPVSGMDLPDFTSVRKSLWSYAPTWSSVKEAATQAGSKVSHYIPGKEIIAQATHSSTVKNGIETFTSLCQRAQPYMPSKSMLKKVGAGATVAAGGFYAAKKGYDFYKQYQSEKLPTYEQAAVGSIPVPAELDAEQMSVHHVPFSAEVIEPVIHEPYDESHPVVKENEQPRPAKKSVRFSENNQVYRIPSSKQEADATNLDQNNTLLYSVMPEQIQGAPQQLKLVQESTEKVSSLASLYEAAKNSIDANVRAGLEAQDEKGNTLLHNIIIELNQKTQHLGYCDKKSSEAYKNVLTQIKEILDSVASDKLFVSSLIYTVANDEGKTVSQLVGDYGFHEITVTVNAYC